MGVIKNFGSGENPVDVLTAFQTQAQKPYNSVYVKFGDGRHSYGYAEFHTMEEFAKEVNYVAREYGLKKSSFSASLTDSTAVISFDNPDLRDNFMHALLGRHVERNDLVVQISNKSREWHQAAGEHLAYVARQRREEKLPDSPTHQKTVVGFGYMLVDYCFSDIEAMQNFCKDVMAEKFDLREMSLQQAGQRLADAKPA